MTWTAGKGSNGYGQFWMDGAKYYAHRISYTLAYGPIPAGFVLDHVVCQNKACVNPAHLRACTVRDNLMAPDGATRMLAERERSKTRCPAGHSYEGENLYVAPDGRRYCRTCRREHVRAHRLRKRLAAGAADN